MAPEPGLTAMVHRQQLRAAQQRWAAHLRACAACAAADQVLCGRGHQLRRAAQAAAALVRGKSTQPH